MHVCLKSDFAKVQYLSLYELPHMDSHYFHNCNVLNRGSYMSANILLNLLNKLKKRDKMRGLSNILSLFHNEFDKFNKPRARM